MKFELKTDNEIYSKSISHFFRIVIILALIIIFCDVAIKLGFISKYHKIYLNCGLLSVEKTNSNFKKLSRLSNLKNKQKIWEFCKEIVK